jgi:hypothetical protein
MTDIEAIRRLLKTCDGHTPAQLTGKQIHQLFTGSIALLAALDAAKDDAVQMFRKLHAMSEERDALKAALEPIADGAAETLHEARTIAQEALS